MCVLIPRGSCSTVGHDSVGRGEPEILHPWDTFERCGCCRLQILHLELQANSSTLSTTSQTELGCERDMPPLLDSKPLESIFFFVHVPYNDLKQMFVESMIKRLSVVTYFCHSILSNRLQWPSHDLVGGLLMNLHISTVTEWEPTCDPSSSPSPPWDQK